MIDPHIISVLQGGYVFALTFGAVSAINILYRPLTAKQNLIASFVFALIFAFIPVNLGNVILNRIRDAIGVAVALNGSYQFLIGVVKAYKS